MSTFHSPRRISAALATVLILLAAAGCGGGGVEPTTPVAASHQNEPAAGGGAPTPATLAEVEESTPTSTEVDADPDTASASTTVDANTIAEGGQLIEAQAEALREQDIAPDAVDTVIASRAGALPQTVHTRVFEAGQVRAGTASDTLDQRDWATYNAAGGSIVVYGRAGTQAAVEDIRMLVLDDQVHLFRDLYLDPNSEHVFIGRSTPVALDGGRADRAHALAAAPPAPAVTGIGGATYDSADIKDGILVAGCGKSFNGALVANDSSGVTPWQIRGRNFGASKGKVFLNTRELSSTWSDSRITVDPTMKWDTAFLNVNVLKVETASGAITTWAMSIAPAIKGRPYGQCTHYVAMMRHQLGLKPSPSAYGNYKEFDANYKPKVGDQYQVKGKHTWIATRVSAAATEKNGVTRWSIRIAERNHECRNGIATLDTSFAIQKSRSGTKVIARPQTRAYKDAATSYYR